MFDVSTQLGVQSWCFREFKPLPDLIAQIKGIGLARTELCGVHADFNNEASFDSIAETFKKAGVSVTSIGVQYFNNNPASEESWFKLAKKLGCSMISTSCNVAHAFNQIPGIVKLADKYDINLGIHNHGGYDWLGSNQILDYVFKNFPKRLGLCLDTAWCMQAGEDPIKTAEKFADRLYGVHIKDFTFLPTGKGEDVIVGSGNLKLPELMKIVMANAGHCKCVTLEYERDVQNPGPKLKECVEAVRKAVK